MLTLQVKLLPTGEQERLLQSSMKEYVSLVNDIVDYALGQGSMPRLSTADVNAPLPSALKNQCIVDAKNIYKKCLKTKIQHILRKPVCIWNNQNYQVKANAIELPVWKDGKSQRMKLKACIPAELLARIDAAKKGSLRITEKNHKLIAQIAIEEPMAAPTAGQKVMGVDLGLKCPAVCRTEDNKTAFFGNGRQNKYKRRYHSQRRKKLGKSKKLKAIKKSHDKERRWMIAVDHKISRQVVNFAKSNNVGTIKLETLSNIRKTARTSRKNNKSLQNWSFYRLSQFIEYKAAIEGIRVVYVDPRYTSQTCPVCGARNKAKDRTYRCACGYVGHRDIVGSINIAKAAPVSSKMTVLLKTTVSGGNSPAA